LISCALFDRADSAQCLQLHQNFVVTNEINCVEERQKSIPIVHRQTRLADEWDLAFSKFDRQCLATDRFKKPATELSMNRHRRADDLVGLWIVEL